MMDDFTRRDFLKGAGLALLGMAVSTSARAQEEKPPAEDDKDAKKPEEEEKKDDLFGSDSTEDEETRACPQCGALMYRQGRTWSCENCGYSYVE
jgi:ribosomal protein S27AE